jgi:hypothetical protein
LTRALFPLLALLLFSACDRFADEERLVLLDVVDAQGRPVEGVKINALPHLAPETQIGGSFQYLARTGQIEEEIFFVLIRESNGARSQPQSAGKATIDRPGVVEVTAADVGSGFFRMRVGLGNSDIREVSFALALDVGQAPSAPAAFVTNSDGRATLDVDEIGVGRTIDLTLTAEFDGTQAQRQVVATDTLDLVLVDREGRAWQETVVARPGLTRVEVVRPDR